VHPIGTIIEETLMQAALENDTDAALRQRVVADHAGVNQQAVALVQKLRVTPEENDTSKSLAQGGVATRDKLKGLPGAGQVRVGGCAGGGSPGRHRWHGVHAEARERAARRHHRVGEQGHVRP
jgi:hypothetical protein